MYRKRFIAKTGIAKASSTYDHIGQYIGQVRIYEGFSQEQLCRGLCTRSFLSRIENGSREADPLLAAALLQRLGKSIDLFTQILSREEFERWQLRQEISTLLRRGKAKLAGDAIAKYLDSSQDLLDIQFAKTAELNYLALLGTAAKTLQALAEEALELTSSGFVVKPFDTLLFSQNEGCLLLAILKLREHLEGIEAVATQYKELLQCLRAPQYESRERIYLFPYVACHVIEAEYRQGRYAAALAICEEALTDLALEKRLFAYDRLLEWKQTLFDAMGNVDQTPRMLLTQLRLIQNCALKSTSLLAPYEDRSAALCLNDVIRVRRNFLEFTQEKLAENICDAGAISRIEHRKRIPQKQNRRSLLKKVNMSGEQYDYEIISCQYMNYLLRSEIGRAINNRDFNRAKYLLDQLRQDIPDNITNRQFILYAEARIRASLPSDHRDWLSPEKRKKEAATALRLTLSHNIENIAKWPVCILTANEVTHLMVYGMCCKQQKQYEEALLVFSYIQRCLKSMTAGIFYPKNFYTSVIQKIASLLGDMGRFQESSQLCEACIVRIGENQDSNLLAMLLYNNAWNMEQRFSNNAAADKHEGREQAISLFRQAYAAALISGDTLGWQHIRYHCIKAYDMDLQLWRAAE